MFVLNTHKMFNFVEIPPNYETSNNFCIRLHNTRAKRKRCYDVTLSRQEGITMRHLASVQYWDQLAGGYTGGLFLTFGGPVCADQISNCPLDRIRCINKIKVQFLKLVGLFPIFYVSLYCADLIGKLDLCIGEPMQICIHWKDNSPKPVNHLAGVGLYENCLLPVCSGGICRFSLL